jgi:6-pyruvoyltetrahydropterin/6-carboxytetrahydropterin synthase
MAFQSRKKYGNDKGLSCCFRQPKATHSHCSTMHGYSLGFDFLWESGETLDDKDWCFDFGNMKPIKDWLDYMFDHTTVISEIDPALEEFKRLSLFSTNSLYNGKPRTHLKPYEEGRLIDLRIVPAVGCERFAKMTHDKASEILEKMKTGELGRYPVNPDVFLRSVEVYEHGSNAAIYSV